ncbi:MAG: hypothetical protein C5B58_11880 [Acidobacteria bacterium]|nr:MAG: hypothetical protein C5B58_11880 [Acidobacteriota bacterium]
METSKVLIFARKILNYLGNKELYLIAAIRKAALPNSHTVWLLAGKSSIPARQTGSAVQDYLIDRGEAFQVPLTNSCNSKKLRRNRCEDCNARIIVLSHCA